MSDAEKRGPVRDLVEFGPFRLEGRERRLRKGDVPVVLPPKVFETLLLLVEHAGHIVTKSELMAALWPNTAVEEGNLTRNIWLIRKALGETDGENRYIETVPKAGYRFVAPIREAAEPTPPPDPALPPATAAGPSLSFPAPSQRRRMPFVAGIGIATALAGAAVLAVLLSRGTVVRAGTSHRTGAAVRARRSVAVLGFQNLSGRLDADWLSTAVSEMMSAELAAGEKLRLVSAESVARAGGVRRPPIAGTLSRETLAGFHASLDADLVLSGSYVAIPSPEGGAIRFDMTLQDTESGESLVTVTEAGNESDLFKLVAAAGGRIRSRLGLEASPSDAGTVSASLPNDRGAARAYAEGLAKLREFDALGARPMLEASIRIEPGFGPAHEALSRAWSALGYDERALLEAETAFRLAGRSPGEARAAEARLAETQKNWERAESLDGSIFRAHPDDLEAGLRLAAVQIAGGRAREALSTLSSLGALPAPAGDDPRIDLARADATGVLSKSRDQLAASRAAAEKAGRNGSTLLLAEARLREAGALRDLVDPARGRQAYETAAALFRNAGERNGEAEALIGIANARSDEGNYDAARDLLRQAQEVFIRIGNRRGEARTLSDLGDLDWLQGNVDAALADSRRVLALNREIGDRRGIVWGLNATGNILADQGRFDEALALQQEGVALSREMEDDGYLAYGFASLGDTFLAQGRLDAARKDYERALALSKKVGDSAGEAAHESDLGNVITEEGALSEAEIRYARSLALRRRLGVKDAVAESEMLFAGLRNDEGKYSEAAQLAAQAGATFAALRQTGNGAISLANQARAELGLGRTAAARSLCERARALLKDNRQNGANLPVLLEAVRVETTAGDFEGARRLLADLRARSRQSGWLYYVLEARRAGAEIELRSGSRPEGLRQIQSLTEDARARGFGLVAAEAENLLRQPPS